MKLLKIIKGVGSVAAEFGTFMSSPRQLVQRRQTDWSKPVKTYQTVLCVLGLVGFLLGTYALVFGPMSASVRSALVGSDESAIEVPRSLVRTEGGVAVVDWGIVSGFGVGVTFPEGFDKPASVPQIAVFRFGACVVALSNITPDVLSKGAIPLLLLLTYSFLLSICLFPCARTLRSVAPLGDTIRYSLLFCSYSVLTATVLASMTAIIFVELIGIRGVLVMLPWSILVLMPWTVLLFRGFFLGYSELFGISKKKVLLATLGAGLISCAVGPIVFIPVVWFWLRFHALWNLIV